MLKKGILVTAVTLLGLGSAAAHAGHDRHLHYVVGGALIGAALGELAYQSRRHTHAYLVHQPPVVHAPVRRYKAARKGPPARHRHRGAVRHIPAPVYFVPPGHRRHAPQVVYYGY